MNNIQKDFKTKSSLRRMADGGIFRSEQNGVPTFTDARAAAPGASRVRLGAPATTPVAAPTAPAPAAPAAPVQTLPTMTVQPPAAATSSLRARPTQTMPPMTVTPPAAPPVSMQDVSDFSGIFSSFSDRAPGYFADGGKVRGPGGPTDDAVGPVMLSDGEYVLPADTVQHVGKQNLDALREATHTPVKAGQPRHMADGGMFSHELGPDLRQRPVVPGTAPAAPGAPGFSAMRGAASKIGGFASKAALPVGAFLGAREASADLDSGYRDKFVRDLGADSSPTATVAADAGRTMATVGDALTFGVAGRIGRGISDATQGGSFGDGFFSQSDRDEYNAQRAAGVLATPTAGHRAAAPASTVPMNTAMGNLRAGREPGGGFETSSVPGIYGRANPNAGKPDESAQQFIGVGKPAAAEDPLMAELRSALRGGGGQPRAAAPAAPVSNAREINSRYDDLAEKISKSYTEKGAGNRAKRLLELEGQRNAALDGDARNISSMRGQDISAATAANNAELQARSSALSTMGSVSNNRNAALQDQQAAQIKALMEAGKVSREGEEKGFERYNEAIGSMFITPDGKPDKVEQERFTTFLQGSDPEARTKFAAMSPQEQSKLLQDMKIAYDMNKARNAVARRGGGATTSRADLPKDVREATLDDYWNKNLPLSDYIYSNLPFTNPNVVVGESGQPALLSDVAVDANGNWDADKLDIIEKRTGKDKKGRSVIRGN